MLDGNILSKRDGILAKRTRNRSRSVLDVEFAPILFVILGLRGIVLILADGGVFSEWVAIPTVLATDAWNP